MANGAWVLLCANDLGVLIYGVRVDLDPPVSSPVTVLSVLLDTGDPEFLAGVYVDVVATDAVYRRRVRPW